MKIKFIYYKIFILFIFIECTQLYIIYPFKTRKPQINDKEKNLTKIFRSLLYNHIYINLDLGEPKQSVDTFLIMDSTELYLSESKDDINTNSPNPVYEDVESN